MIHSSRDASKASLGRMVRASESAAVPLEISGLSEREVRR